MQHKCQKQLTDSKQRCYIGRMSKSHDKARSELAAYLKGTQYEIADPLADNRSLAEREKQANREVSLLVKLDNRFRRTGTLDNGFSQYQVRGEVNHRMIDALESEFGKCCRCKQARIGECVDIISGLTSNNLRVHLACVEDGDELA